MNSLTSYDSPIKKREKYFSEFKDSYFKVE